LCRVFADVGVSDKGKSFICNNECEARGKIERFFLFFYILFDKI